MRGIASGVLLAAYLVIGNILEFRARRVATPEGKLHWYLILHPECFSTPEAQRRRALSINFYRIGGLVLILALLAVNLL